MSLSSIFMELLISLWDGKDMLLDVIATLLPARPKSFTLQSSRKTSTHNLILCKGVELSKILPNALKFNAR